MGAILLPGIEELDPESLCYSIYTQLYQNFFNAQDAGTVTEGDSTSIRLRNTAYGFAEAIAGGVTGDGGASGGALSAYLKRCGGDMSGLLRADYGFSAGIGNTRVLETFREENSVGVRISGQLHVDGDGFYLGGHRVLRYTSDTGTTEVDCTVLSLGDTPLRTNAEILVGDATTGVRLTPELLQVAGHNVYHGGNANNPATDWAMHNATVAGTLTVAGGVTLNGPLTALYGVTLGDGNNTRLHISGADVALNADLSILGEHSVYLRGKAILAPAGEDSLALNAPGGELLLGYAATTALRLLSPLKDQLGTHTLLTPAGEAYFPGSLRVAHNLGPDLLTTYYTSSVDTGIVVHRFLRLGDAAGPGITHAEGRLLFTSAVMRTVEDREQKTWHEVVVGHEVSESPQAPADKSWDDLFIRTDAHHIHLGNPLYAEKFVGIAGSATRLEKECLFLTDTYRLQAVAGGIKHYGQALFTEGISSELFSSGLAGSGWAVQRNATTGAATATFDDLVVRRRMRVYEMEVQRTRATDGSLWISDSCSGDSVERL